MVGTVSRVSDLANGRLVEISLKFSTVNGMPGPYSCINHY